MMPAMPNVIGLQVQNALQYMVLAGVRESPLGYFQVDPVTMSWANTAQRAGYVVEQNPAFGTSMAPNAPAVLTISSFPMAVSTDGPVGDPTFPGDMLLDQISDPFILDVSRLR